MIKSEFEKKMDVIVEEHKEMLDGLNDDIKYVEYLRSDYDECNSAFKGFSYLFKLYDVNFISKRIASLEMFNIVGKFLAALLFYAAAYLFNSLFILNGYFTGVNGYVVSGFLIFTIVFMIKKSNVKTKELLQSSQEAIREHRFKIYN